MCAVVLCGFTFGATAHVPVLAAVQVNSAANQVTGPPYEHWSQLPLEYLAGCGIVVTEKVLVGLSEYSEVLRGSVWYFHTCIYVYMIPIVLTQIRCVTPICYLCSVCV